MCTHTSEAFERLCGAGLACLMRMALERVHLPPRITAQKLASW